MLEIWDIVEVAQEHRYRGTGAQLQGHRSTGKEIQEHRYRDTGAQIQGYRSTGTGVQEHR